LVYLVGSGEMDQTDLFRIPAVEAILDGNVAWPAGPPR